MQTLDETVVTATAMSDEQVKGSDSRITASDLLKRGAVSLPDVLQREPGVSVPLDFAGVDTLVPYLEGGSKGINIRGLEGNRVQVLVDGIPQPDDFVSRSFQGSGGPGRIYFDPAVFSTLDLFKAASPGSGSLAGTIAGQTESPWTLLGDELVGTAFNGTTTYASSNRSWNQRFATAWGNGDLASSLVYSYRNGHELENHGSLGANPSDAESHAVIWKTVFRNGGWTFEPTVDYFRSDSMTDLDSIEVDSLVGRTFDATNDSERERLRLSLDFEYEPNSPGWFADRVTGKLYFQSSTSENLNRQGLLTPDGDLRNRINQLAYQTDRAGFNLGAFKDYGNHSLSYQYQGARSDITGSLNRQDGSSDPVDLPNLAPSIVWDHSLSIADEVSIGDRWTMTPGVRIQHYLVHPTNTDEFLAQSSLPVFDEFGRLIGQRSIEAVDYENTFLSPSLHLEYEASDAFTLFGSYTLGYRNPTAEELAGVFVHPDNLSIALPNPDLEAEDSHSFELGFRHESGAWATTVSGYYNRYGNFLESNVATGEVIDGLDVLRTQNTRNAEVYGIEMKSEWSSDQVRVGGSFAWSEGMSDDGPLNTVEPWKAVAYLGYDQADEKFGFELAGTYVAAKSSSDISGDLPATDDYFLVDLTGYYRLSENVVFRGGVKNILDQEYVLWSRANRGAGHEGGVSNSRDTQPGINGFVSLEFEF
ncbi:TonB-dependent receptor [Verrucomicrobiaceae bacterium 227]